MTEQEAIENLRKGRSCGDLISRKALIQSLRNNVLVDVTPNLEQAIEELPTAYDVDKVVGQIKTMEICGSCLNNQNPTAVCASFCDIGKKLEIVKAGGVNE